MAELRSYKVWDVPTRLFHWINALSVIGLIGVGLVILNGGALGLNTPGKIALKTVHVTIGYVFAVNLAWRFVWGFVGNRYARWSAMLPLGAGYLHALREDLAARRAGQPRRYLGHNPIGRISVAVLLTLLLVQAVTGLVLAGTDLFWPPIGHWISQWIALSGVDPASLQPYARDTYDATAYAAMRDFRKPFAVVHVYAFYTLCGFVVLHIAAVVVTEIREGGGLVSAMFTGRKILDRPPEDA